jgi:hypothetical protein
MNGYGRLILLTVVGLLLILLGAQMIASSKADPTCGDGMFWDWKHQICQSFPVPPPPPVTFVPDPNTFGPSLY